MTDPTTPDPTTSDSADQVLMALQARALELTLAGLQAERMRITDKLDRRIAEARESIERMNAATEAGEPKAPAGTSTDGRGRPAVKRTQTRQRRSSTPRAKGSTDSS